MKKNPQRPLPHSTNTVKLVVVLMVFELRTTMVKPLLFWDSRCWSPGTRESAMIKKWPVLLWQNFLGSVSSWSADGAVVQRWSRVDEWVNEWMSEWVNASSSPPRMASCKLCYANAEPWLSGHLLSSLVGYSVPFFVSYAKSNDCSAN